jgi:hypothetical protein
MKDVKLNSVYVLFDEKHSFFVKTILELEDSFLLYYSEYLTKLGLTESSLIKTKTNLNYLLNNMKHKNGFKGMIEIPEKILKSLEDDKSVGIFFPFVQEVFNPKKSVKTGEVNWKLDYLVNTPSSQDFREWRMNEILS